MYDFSADYNSIDKSDMLGIRKYLIAKNNTKNMLRLIKQVFVVLLSFSESLATMNSDELCMVWSNLIDLNPIELKYYPFMIILDKFSGNCNILSPKECVPKNIKDISVKSIWWDEK